MKIIRAILILTIPLLLLTPFASVHLIRENNRAFDEEMQRHIAATGSADGLYGDCSGMSIIIPLFIAAFSIGILLWSVITLILSGSVSKAASLAQMIVIVCFTGLCLFWSVICFLR